MMKICLNPGALERPSCFVKLLASGVTPHCLAVAWTFNSTLRVTAIDK